MNKEQDIETDAEATFEPPETSKRFYQPRMISRLHLSYLLGLILAAVSVSSLLYIKVFVGYEARLNQISVRLDLTCDRDGKKLQFDVTTATSWNKFNVFQNYTNTDKSIELYCKHKFSVSRTEFKSAKDQTRTYQTAGDMNSDKYDKKIKFYKPIELSFMHEEFGLDNILHRTSFSQYETFIEILAKSNQPTTQIDVQLTIFPQEDMSKENRSPLESAALTPTLMRPQPANLNEALFAYSRFEYRPSEIPLTEFKSLSEIKGSPVYTGKKAYYIQWVDKRKERLEDILSILFATLLGVSISLIAEAFMAGSHQPKRVASKKSQN